MNRLVLLCAAFIVAASPAWAVMAPHYYEQARREAPDVVVVRILRVTLPRGRYGVCAVASQVTAVERGARYRVGQQVSIPVHCAYRDADYPDGGTLWTDIPRLRTAQSARVFLRDGRPALDAFDILR